MVFILLTIFLAFLLLTYKYRKLNYWESRGFMQVNENAWHFLIGKCSLSEIYKKIYNNYPSEEAIGTYLGFKPVLLIKNLDNVQAVLNRDFHSFYARGYHTNSNDTMTDNLLLIDNYSRWRVLRHSVSPVFTALKLKNMFYTLERCASDFVVYIKTNENSSENYFGLLHKYVSASMSATVFGINSQSENTMVCPLMDYGWDNAESLLVFNLKFALSSFIPKLYDLLNLTMFGRNKHFVIGLTKKVFSSRREHKAKRHDFVDTCLKMQDTLILEDCQTGFQLMATDEVLAAQVLSFFVAGVDTSTNTLNFTLMELSNNPIILKRLHEEIDDVFDNCQERLTYEAVNRMPYLEMVLNETLRKYPPVGVIQRMCVKNTVLPVGDIKIERDTHVAISVYAMHRDKRYFPNPDVFDPERFSPENITSIVKTTYMPFGEGNRACIGGRYALLQIKTGLASLLRTYTLRGHGYLPKVFEPSFFNIRYSKSHYDLIPRNN